VKEVVGPWDVNNHKVVDLYSNATKAVSNNTYSTSSPAGAKIGTARVRNVEYETGTGGAFNSTYKLFLYDIQMTSNTFSNVKSVFVNNALANSFADIVSSPTSLNETDFNKVIFKVPANNIRRLRDTNGNIDTNFQFTKRFDITIASDGTFSLATGAVDETFPYGVTALNASQKRDNFYLVLNANAESLANVDTGSMSSGANTVTGLTSATSKFNIGDVINLNGYSNNFTVTAVSSTTLSTLQPANIVISTEGIKKKFFKGQVVDMSGNGGDGSARIISIASSTGASFNIQETLTNTVDATVITDLIKVDGNFGSFDKKQLVQINSKSPSGNSKLKNLSKPIS
jgi:hypothetical protein